MKGPLEYIVPKSDIPIIPPRVTKLTTLINLHTCEPRFPACFFVYSCYFLLITTTCKVSKHHLLQIGISGNLGLPRVFSHLSSVVRVDLNSERKPEEPFIAIHQSFLCYATIWPRTGKIGRTKNHWGPLSLDEKRG